MEAVAWTAMVLSAAAIVVLLTYIRSKIDDLERTLLDAFDRLDDSLSSRIDAMAGRIDTQVDPHRPYPRAR